MRVDVRREPFTVAGSNLEQIRRVLAVVGPMRGGVRFAAYTDWEVTYRVGPASPPEVHVSAVLRLPRWAAPPWASRDLVARWERYTGALERHEDGHVAIAKAAGEAVLARLSALPPGADPNDVRRVAAEAVAELRAIERAYDEDTRHGAAQGAVLSFREVA